MKDERGNVRVARQATLEKFHNRSPSCGFGVAPLGSGRSTARPIVAIHCLRPTPGHSAVVPGERRTLRWLFPRRVSETFRGHLAGIRADYEIPMVSAAEVEGCEAETHSSGWVASNRALGSETWVADGDGSIVCRYSAPVCVVTAVSNPQNVANLFGPVGTIAGADGTDTTVFVGPTVERAELFRWLSAVGDDDFVTFAGDGGASGLVEAVVVPSRRIGQRPSADAVDLSMDATSPLTCSERKSTRHGREDVNGCCASMTRRYHGGGRGKRPLLR